MPQRHTGEGALWRRGAPGTCDALGLVEVRVAEHHQRETDLLPFRRLLEMGVEQLGEGGFQFRCTACLLQLGVDVVQGIAHGRQEHRAARLRRARHPGVAGQIGIREAALQRIGDGIGLAHRGDVRSVFGGGLFSGGQCVCRNERQGQ